jgi:hypothetical protein
MKYSVYLLCPLIAFSICGCSSIIDAHKQKMGMMEMYDSGNFTSASEYVNKKAESHSGTGDQVMWALEAGTIDFDAGNYEQSLKHLEQAEQLIKDFDRRAEISFRDAGAEAGSALTNLNALPYRGFCYDRILLNSYKALAYFALNKPSAAMVELRRMRYTQQEVYREFEQQIEQQRKEIELQQAENRKKSAEAGQQQNGEVSFDAIRRSKQVEAVIKDLEVRSENAYGAMMNPFATYMSALGFLYQGNYGEAVVDFRNLYRMNKNNPLTNRDYVSVATRLGGERLPEELAQVKPLDYPLDRNIVFVIFANGRGPALIQEKFWLILPWVGYTGLAFPRYEYYKAFFQKLEICGGGGSKPVDTLLLADMNKIASQEYKQRLPVMITRIVISYLTKEVASLAITQVAAAGDPWVQLGAYAATGVYKYLFNTADTRCWETLPGQYQLAHIPIPPDRKLSITPVPQTSAAKSFEVQLKNDTRFAIVYVRAIEAGAFTYKTFEFNQEN